MCLAGNAAGTYSALGRSGVFHHLASETRVRERGHYKQRGWGFAQVVELSVLKQDSSRKTEMAGHPGWRSPLPSSPLLLYPRNLVAHDR